MLELAAEMHAVGGNENTVFLSLCKNIYIFQHTMGLE